MKRGQKVIFLVLVVFALFLTGCIKIEVHHEIHSDGSSDVTMLYDFKEYFEQLGSLNPELSSGDILQAQEDFKNSCIQVMADYDESKARLKNLKCETNDDFQMLISGEAQLTPDELKVEKGFPYNNYEYNILTINELMEGIDPPAPGATDPTGGFASPTVGSNCDAQAPLNCADSSVKNNAGPSLYDEFSFLLKTTGTTKGSNNKIESVKLSSTYNTDVECRFYDDGNQLFSNGRNPEINFETYTCETRSDIGTTGDTYDGEITIQYDSSSGLTHLQRVPIRGTIEAKSNTIPTGGAVSSITGGAVTGHATDDQFEGIPTGSSGGLGTGAGLTQIPGLTMEYYLDLPGSVSSSDVGEIEGGDLRINLLTISGLDTATAKSKSFNGGVYFVGGGLLLFLIILIVIIMIVNSAKNKKRTETIRPTMNLDSPVYPTTETNQPKETVDENTTLFEDIPQDDGMMEA